MPRLKNLGVAGMVKGVVLFVVLRFVLWRAYVLDNSMRTTDIVLPRSRSC